MVSINLNYMLLGAIVITSLLVGLFFLRFWRTTHDRFFLLFALSFLIEGCNRLLLGVNGALNEDAPAYYLIRLLTYGLILAAILIKNFPRKKRK